MKKKLLALLMTCSLVLPLAAIPTASAAAAPVVYLDGEKLTFSTNPIIKNGSTLVPMRLIFEKQGAKVSWNNTTKTVTATKGSTTIKYTIGQKQATVNNSAFTLNAPGEILKGSTMVPLRFVSESLGNSVGWFNKSKTVTISSASMQKAKVTRVVDGDTIEVTLNDGSVEKVRLIGIDTPESVHPDADRNTSEGVVVSDYTKSQLLNKTVLLEFDAGERDTYGRLLAYVYLNGNMYNAKLAEEGYATQMTYQPNVRWVDLFTALVANARSNNRGLWAYDGEVGSAVKGTTGKLVIEKVDYANEIVTIKNKDSKTINLTGWKLVSVKGNQVYNFPDGYTLAPGKTVYVTSGKNAKEAAGYLKWTTANVHNNDENDPAKLYDMNGKLISSY
ncbi:stalk domain-containing protein [Neobacillus mesonae]|nr:stalk domain-containing protein [Neobacillus mesonae]